MDAVASTHEVDDAVATATLSWGAGAWLTCSLPTATRDPASMVRSGRSISPGSEYSIYLNIYIKNFRFH